MSGFKSSQNKRFSLLLTAALMLAALTGLYLLPSQAQVSVGKQGSFYIIATSADLAAFRDKVNVGSADISAKLTADIYLGNVEWASIGSGAYDEESDSMVGKPFSGVFDGQGHTVSGLYISNGKSFQGLFGFVSGDKSEIRNLTVSGDVKGGDYVGGIAGVAVYGSSIINCAASGSVSGNHNVGGIVGQTGWYDKGGCTITNCTANTDVSGTGDGIYAIAGIVGYAADSSIANCTASGSVSGTGDNNCYVGGIAGVVYCNRAITNCAVNADVSGNNSIGGIAGVVYNSPISNCAASGSVSGTGDNNRAVGGIAGLIYNNSSIMNCAVSGSVSGNLSFLGGIAGEAASTDVMNCGWLANSAPAAVGANTGDVTITDVVSYDTAQAADVAVTCLPETFLTSVGTYNSKIVSFITYPSNKTGVMAINALNVSPDNIASAAPGDKSVTITGKEAGSGLVNFDVTLEPTSFIFSGGKLKNVSTDVSLSLATGLTVNSTDEGGSGCSTGMGALALLTAVPIMINMRKRRK